MTAPSVRDPDLFLDAVIAERHHTPAAKPEDPIAARAAIRDARKTLWDAHRCILGVLWHPLTAPDIAKFTGLKIGVVCASLIEMESAELVRKAGEQKAGWNGELFDLWEKVIAT